MRSINFEVLAVNGKDPAQTLAFGDAHQSGISKIHRQIAILPHEFAHPRTIVGAELGEYQSASTNHVPQCSLVPGVVAQKMHRFRKCGPHGEERIVNSVKRSGTPPMVGVGTINDCDERSGVDEYAWHPVLPAAFA